MADIAKENTLLQNVFQICLKADEAYHTKVHLPSYEIELKNNKKELYLRVDDIYFILLHKIAQLYKEKKNCLSYLFSCFVRVSDKTCFKNFNFTSEQINAYITEITEQITNSMIVFLENLNVYPNVKITYEQRISIFYEFLEGSCNTRFLKKLLKNIEENEDSKEQYEQKLKTIFNPIIDLMNQKMNNVSLTTFHKSSVILFQFITSIKELSDIIVNHKTMFLHLNVNHCLKDNWLEQEDSEEKQQEAGTENSKNKIEPANQGIQSVSNNIGINNSARENYGENNTNGNIADTVVSSLLSNLNSTNRNVLNQPNYNNNNTGMINNTINPNSSTNNQREKKCSTDKEIGACGYQLQMNSLLGKLLTPTVLVQPNLQKQENIMYKYFFDPTKNKLKQMTLSELNLNYYSLRDEQNWLIGNVTEGIKCLLKANAECRKKTLLWLCCIILSNEKKTKIMYHFSAFPQSLDPSYGLLLKLLGENSYGFCMNMFWVLLKLCEPITVSKISDMDAFFFLRDDPFSKFILKNITNQSSFEDKSNVEKIKERIKHTEAYKTPPKFITCIFWVTFKAISVFFKPAVDEFIRITQHVNQVEDKTLYYMHIHVWKIFLYNPVFIELLFKFLDLAMSYILHVAYVYDLNGEVNEEMQTLLKNHQNNVVSLVKKCCPPPNENYKQKGKGITNNKQGNIINQNNQTDAEEKKEITENNQNEQDSKDIVNENSVQRNNGTTISSSAVEEADQLKASPQFSIIPTFFLSDIFEVFYLLYDLDHIFKTKNRQQFQNYLDMELFISFSIFSMLSEKHIKCIHLRCEEAPKTFSYLYKYSHMKKVIEDCEVTQKYIIKALTNVFIGSQKGAYTERMQTRVRIVENFNCFFLNKTYVDQFTELVTNNHSIFVHLIHLLLNDVNFLVEEVVAYLSEIKRREMRKSQDHEEHEPSERNANNRNSNSNSINDRNRNRTNGRNGRNRNGEEGISDNSDPETGGMDHDLTNESMRNLAAKTKMIITYCYKSCIFLNLLCQNYAKHIIASNTILTQIVTCLNCYFDYLAGPKCLNIKVKNMEEYKFRPHLWLKSIVESYLYLMEAGPEQEELLIREIANEGRYYKPEIFNKAHYICKRESLLIKENLNKFKEFCQKIIDMKDEVSLFDNIGNIPDHFLDPILQDIMLDPVMLPTSGIVIDRKNIERHLMSEPNDPFNRAPLTKEQLVPVPDLKKEIHEFIEKIREERREKMRQELELKLQKDLENERVMEMEHQAEVKTDEKDDEEKKESILDIGTNQPLEEMKKSSTEGDTN